MSDLTKLAYSTLGRFGYVRGSIPIIDWTNISEAIHRLHKTVCVVLKQTPICEQNQAQFGFAFASRFRWLKRINTWRLSTNQRTSRHKVFRANIIQEQKVWRGGSKAVFEWMYCKSMWFWVPNRVRARWNATCGSIGWLGGKWGGARSGRLCNVFGCVVKTDDLRTAKGF